MSIIDIANARDTLAPEQGTVASAFQAQDLLRAMTKWHAKNESEVLPTELLCMLYAARRVC